MKRGRHTKREDNTETQKRRKKAIYLLGVSPEKDPSLMA